MNEFFDLVKNILICCCLLASLSAACVQEQTNDKLTAQISELSRVAWTMQECVYQVETAGLETNDKDGEYGDDQRR